MKLYSYILRWDEGAAPNPFWGLCTLAICKPAIRRKAQVGDWVIGTGSKNAKCNDGNTHDLSASIVYAMKISNVNTMEEYNTFCQTLLPKKIPNWNTQDWRLQMGDCIYDYSQGVDPFIRLGVHNESNRDRDLGGLNVLMSDHFYYFGEEARELPPELRPIIKQNQGHRKIESLRLIVEFEKWILKFEKNKIYADPQMRSLFDVGNKAKIISTCSKNDFEDDGYETEDIIY